MKSLIKPLLGLNTIALIHLVRLQPKRFLRACNKAFTAANRAASDALVQIPEIDLGDLLGHREFVMRMSVMPYEDGQLPREQTTALLFLLMAEAPSVVLEIGTYMGYTTRQMAENLSSAIIHTVDLPEGGSVERDLDNQFPKDDYHLIARRVVGRDFKGHPCANRIKQHFADTADWDFRLAGNPTFFFIDGSHTYEYCKHDSEKCFELCKGRGAFLWHDCDQAHPGVVRLVSEWRREGRDVRRIAGTPIAYWKGA